MSTGLKEAVRQLTRWSSLRRAGKNRLLKSAYVWIAVVPFTVRATEHLGSIPSLQWAAFTLPFSWQIFFFASLCVAIGDIVFAISCPPLIRQFGTYAEFAEEGAASWRLTRFLATDVLRSRKQLPVIDVAQTVRDFAERAALKEVSDDQFAALASDYGRIVVFADSLEVNGQRRTEAFWIIREFEDLLSPSRRALCAAMYAAGFSLFALVMAQNIWFVISHQFLERES